MATEKQEAIDIGHDMADLLLAWRPGFGSSDVASAIMYALEHYSIQIEGSGETGLRTCLFLLKDKIDQRIMSI